MKDAARFIKYFPAPSERSNLDWQIIDRYMRKWHKDFEASIRRQKEEEEVRHLEENFMFDENERFF